MYLPDTRLGAKEVLSNHIMRWDFTWSAHWKKHSDMKMGSSMGSMIVIPKMGYFMGSMMVTPMVPHWGQKMYSPMT